MSTLVSTIDSARQHANLSSAIRLFGSTTIAPWLSAAQTTRMPHDEKSRPAG
jgi:hypothetical protein